METIKSFFNREFNAISDDLVRMQDKKWSRIDESTFVIHASKEMIARYVTNTLCFSQTCSIRLLFEEQSAEVKAEDIKESVLWMNKNAPEVYAVGLVPLLTDRFPFLAKAGVAAIVEDCRKDLVHSMLARCSNIEVLRYLANLISGTAHNSVVLETLCPAKDISNADVIRIVCVSLLNWDKVINKQFVVYLYSLIKK